MCGDRETIVQITFHYFSYNIRLFTKEKYFLPYYCQYTTCWSIPTEKNIMHMFLIVIFKYKTIDHNI